MIYLRPTAIDLTGKVFGYLTVVQPVESNDGVIWELRCVCGNLVRKRTGHLRYSTTAGTGKWLSCGCVHNFRTHGVSDTRIYKIWAGIKKRCYQSSSRTFVHYGARGIKMCAEWLADPVTFYEWAVANGYEPHLTIERRDVNGDYCPENCCWITKAAQTLNTRVSRRLTMRGETKTLAEWAAQTGIGHTTIIGRLRRKWPIEEALTVPAVIGRNQNYRRAP